jgi:molecular chaperone DnaK
MGRAIGIDLGTSYSCVSTVINGDAKVIPNAQGELTHASVVCIKEDGTRVVGNEAKRQMLMFPENTVYSAKRLIGRKFFSSEVKKAMAVCPYEITEVENDGVAIRVGGRDYSLPEISAMVLMEMKQIAEDYLKDEVVDAVITVPAYFNDGQRQATKNAGAIAGLNVLRIINEPTAAALAYGFGKGLEQKVIIYDLGGGTFDVSVLAISDDVYEVISTAGDTYLGGDDFDDRLLDHMADAFVSEHNINIRKDKFALQKLKNLAEETKIRLSNELQVAIDDDDFYTDPESGQVYGLHVPAISRNFFAKLVFDLVQKTFKVCDEALQAAGMTSQQMDGIILVGGPTKMPIIQEAVESYFFRKPLDDVNPDQVVAIGAAIQGDSLVGGTQSSLLIDVTPQSLGIGMIGGLMDIIIERNSPIPTDKTRKFTTSSDNQTMVKIPIFQGEGRHIQDNEPLGELILEELRAAPRGDVKIEVTFEIDTNGIVNISAEDSDTNTKQQMQVNVSGGLSEDAIDKLKQENEDFLSPS